MGADGWIEIFDLDKGKELGLLSDTQSTDTCKQIYELRRLLQSNQVYTREIFGHNVLTVYSDTEGRRELWNPEKLTPEEQKYIDEFTEKCSVDYWTVWT